MKFVPMESLPGRKQKKPLAVLFKEFIAMNVKIVKVDLNEHDYKSPKIARSVLGLAAKRHCVPVKVCMRDDEIYFVRTDM